MTSAKADPKRKTASGAGSCLNPYRTKRTGPDKARFVRLSGPMSKTCLLWKYAVSYEIDMPCGRDRRRWGRGSA